MKPKSFHLFARPGYRVLSALPLLLALGACGDAPAEDSDESVSALAGSAVCEGLPQILGTKGNDVLTAGEHGSCLLGGKGNDTLLGGGARDVLVGGNDNDVLHGGKGNDVLVGGPGSDILYGDKGNDSYLFYPEDDDPRTVDKIIDGIGNNDVRCMNGLKATRKTNGSTLVLTFPKGGTVEIENVDHFNSIQCDEPTTPPPPAVRSLPNNAFGNIGKTDDKTMSYIGRSWTDFKNAYVVNGAVKWEGNVDTSIEAMTRTLAIAYALKDESTFTAILNWVEKNMRVMNPDNPYVGYMSWTVNIANPTLPCSRIDCNYVKSEKDPAGKSENLGPAADGEIWYTTALLLGAKRWNKPAWLTRARENLALYARRPRNPSYTPLFDRTSLLPVFAPNIFFFKPAYPYSNFTDPAYIVPSFFQYWNNYSSDFDWATAARNGRMYFDKATNAETGLIAESGSFTGEAVDGSPSGAGLLHGNDSPQVAVNRVLDWQSGYKPQSAADNALHIVNFFESHGTGQMWYPNGMAGSRPQNDGLQKCMLGLWATILPQSAPVARRDKWLNALWTEQGGDWYAAQYCLLGKVIAAGLFDLNSN